MIKKVILFCINVLFNSNIVAASVKIKDEGINSTSNKNSIKMESSGITITSDSDIKLVSKGKISLTPTGNAEVTSKGDVKLTGNNVNAKANMALSLQGTASARRPR